jgi:hypothetical protein
MSLTPREFTRVRIRFAVSVNFGDDAWSVVDETRDLSLNGVYVVSSATPKVGSECDVRITLDEGTGVRVDARGRVVRVDERGFALGFTALDIESYHHLQKLVQYNALDPAKAEREFQEHLGLKRVPPPAEP